MNTGIWSWFCPLYTVNFILVRCPADAMAALIAGEIPDEKARAVITEGFSSVTPEVIGRMTASFTTAYGLICVIWLRPDAGLATVVHEIEHVVYTVMDERGIRHSDSSDEAFAYYTGWLMREVIYSLFPEGVAQHLLKPETTAA